MYALKQVRQRPDQNVHNIHVMLGESLYLNNNLRHTTSLLRRFLAKYMKIVSTFMTIEEESDLECSSGHFGMFVYHKCGYLGSDRLEYLWLAKAR